MSNYLVAPYTYTISINLFKGELTDKGWVDEPIHLRGQYNTNVIVEFIKNFDKGKYPNLISEMKLND